MLFIIVSLVFSKVIQCNNTNLDFFEGRDDSYALFCLYDYSQQLFKEHIDQIYLCSRLIPTLDIVIVNCTNIGNEPICLKYDSAKETKLYLITSNSLRFHGEFIAFDFLMFFEQNTNSSRINFTTTFSELTPDTFFEYQSTKTSTIVAFLDLTEEKSRIMIPQIQQIAFIFSRKPKIGVAFVDCNKYLDFCIDKNVEFVPTFRSYNENSFVDFKGQRYFHDLLAFTNSLFKEFRSANGELNRNAGIIQSLTPLVIKFMKDSGKKGTIVEAERISGSELYIRVMKRILKNGDCIIDKDIAAIRSTLKKSPEKLSQNDLLRENLNILKEFKRARPYIHDDSEL